MPVFCKYVAPGNVADIRPGADRTAGQVQVVGTKVTIIAHDIDFSDKPQGTTSLTGIWDVPQRAAIITAGDLVYWDAAGNPVGGTPGTGAATTVSAGNNLMGVAVPLQPNDTNATAATDQFVRIQLAGLSVNLATVGGAITAVTSINGTAGAAGGAGGNVPITAGAGHTNGAGGTAGITGGAGAGTGAGGAVNLTGGNSGAGVTGNGGASAVAGGAAASTNGTGGMASVIGGIGTGTGAGGECRLRGGVGGATGTGGAVAILSGASAGAGGTAGNVTIDCGAATGGAAGTITIGAANAASVTITAALTVGNSVRAAGTTFSPFIPHGADAAAVAPTAAIPITNYYSKLDTTAGATTQTLADGAVIGQLKKIHMAVDNGDDVVTPANLKGAATIITFADAGDYVVLVWDGGDWVCIEAGNSVDGVSAPVIS
jgi:hypothetical protein